MATTYCTNLDLVLDNGKKLEGYLHETELTRVQKEKILDDARLKAYNIINTHERLRNRTMVPATHIDALVQVEVDLVAALILASAFTQKTRDRSEWPQTYQERAAQVLDKVHYSAVAEVPQAENQNVGNGIITVISVDDIYTMTELITLNATSSTDFTVYGTVSGLMPSLDVGVQWPEKDWVKGPIDYGMQLGAGRFHYSEFPIKLLAAQGSTLFANDDKFIIKTWASSDNPVQTGISTGKLVRA